MSALCGTSLGALGHVNTISEVENRQKWTNLNRYISKSTDIDEKRFVVFEHTIDQLFYGYVHFTLTWVLFFFYSSRIIYF